LEEIQAVGDGLRETLQIEPDVERAVGNSLDVEAYFFEALDYVVAFVLFLLEGWKGEVKER